DGKALYVASADSPDVWAFTLESAGNPVKGRVLCRLEANKGEPAGGAGVAVDARGNVYVANPGRRVGGGVRPGGARLGAVTLPQEPLYVALGGEGGKQLLAASAENVYAVELTVGPALTRR